ncbi:MAG TPA: hypothetical protein VMD77_16205, partial [Candidatus Baltobacteraceae bacterium]|nr:hypothetical protein [Candidatus Baltobacteraceae bacterium]
MESIFFISASNEFTIANSIIGAFNSTAQLNRRRSARRAREGRECNIIGALSPLRHMRRVNGSHSRGRRHLLIRFLAHAFRIGICGASVAAFLCFAN